MADDKKFTPVLPYDSTYGEYFPTYDNMTYRCDRDLCHPNITKSTGNIVKYYEYKIGEEKAIISEE